MNKEEYLSAVWERIGYLPPEDIRRSLDYYRELIDDRMEEGMTEAQAVAAMPTVEEAAAQILADAPTPPPPPPTPQPAYAPEPEPPRRRLGAWAIILLILGSPVWLPLVLTAGVLVLVAYILVWVLVVTLFAVVFSFGAANIAWVIYGVIQLVTGGILQAMFYFGAALIGGGIVELLIPASKRLIKGVIYLGKLPFRRKGDM